MRFLGLCSATVLGLIAMGNGRLDASPPLLVLQDAPESSVVSVTVSPDGSLIASDSFDGRVRLHDANSGALVRAINTGGGRKVAFAPDGRILACAGYHMDKKIGLFEVGTGKLVRKLDGHTEIETYAIAFSPDGRWLASAGTDKQILVWELASGTLKHQLTNQPFPITALAFSPDSAILASGGGDKTVRLWDTQSGQLCRTLEGHRDWVVSLAFTPEGRTIASGDCDWAYHRGRDPSYFDRPDPGCQSQWKLWDTATGQLKRTETEPGRLLSLALAPDGLGLACGVGNEVRWHDLRAEASGRVVTTHNGPITSVAFSHDGASIFSGSHDHTVRRTRLRDDRVEWRTPGHYEQVNSVALANDGSILATGSSDIRFALRVFKASAKGIGPGTVRLWDPRTGRRLRLLGDPAEQVLAVALSPDGRLVAGGGARPDGSGSVHLWETATGAPIWSLNNHRTEVQALAFAPDGSMLATAGADGQVKLRDPGTGSVTRTLDGHEGGATSLGFSSNSALLACGEGHGGTRLWDARTGRRLRTCKDAGSRAQFVTTDRMITAVALSPDGGTLAACPATMGNTYGDPLRLWSTTTGEFKPGFTAPAPHGRPIALSPDGTIVATGGKTIALWDVATGKRLRNLTGHLKKTQSIIFSADGRLLVGGGSYGTTNLWEVATGRLLATFFAFPESRGKDGAEDWLATTPDGFYQGSPGVARYLAWRVGDELQTPKNLGPQLHRPDRLESSLKLLREKTGSP